MSKIVATVVSQPQPYSGKEHDSSPNFVFEGLPREGKVKVEISENANASKITFVLWKNINNRPDRNIPNTNNSVVSSNGSEYEAEVLEENQEYYIGDPENAGWETFRVTFKVD